MQVAYFRWKLILRLREFEESFDGIICLVDSEGGETFILLFFAVS